MPVTSLTSFSPLPPPPPPPAAPKKPPEPPAATSPPPAAPPPAPPAEASRPDPTPPPAPAPALLPEPMPELAAEPEAEAAGAGTNLLVAAARGWPWLLVGLAAGVVFGLLYHMQRPPVYQSRSELLVIKNRAETATGAAPDVRVTYLDDYVATQYRLVQSTQILQLASRRLKDPRPAGFPADERGQVAYLTSHLAVTREREPGSNALSNTLTLSFRGPDPTDARRCLQAIIEAYEMELGTVYERASGNRLKTLEGDIGRLTNELSKAAAKRKDNEGELNTISQERLESIRARITNNRTEVLALRLKKSRIEADLKKIENTGPTRQARLAMMDQLGVRPERDYINTSADVRTPEDLLLAYELEKAQLGRRLGKDHPDMIALNNRLEFISKQIEKRNAGTGGRVVDELERHKLKLKNDLDAVTDQITELTHVIETDDTDAARMSRHQTAVERLSKEEQQLEEKIKEKEREKGQVSATVRSGGYEVQPITPPSDGVQVAPVLYQSLLLGGVLGLLLGGCLAVVAEVSDRSFRTPAEIRRRLGVPVLGHIPKIQTGVPAAQPSAGGLDPLLACYLRPKSMEAEAVRGVRTQLYFSTRGRGHQVIQVTSPTPADGKSTLAANLAISIAQSGKRVVLLDCDFRKPRVHKLFNLQHPEVGLASVVAGEAKLSSAVRSCEIENLFVMPCGPRPDNPAELLTSPKFQEVLAELKGQYDFVVVDTPPVLAVTDPVAVAPRVDGVLMVFRMTKHARPSAERAREQLAAVGARVMGVIVNASSARSAGYGGYGYSYQYDFQYSDNYATAEEQPLSLPKKG